MNSHTLRTLCQKCFESGIWNASWIYIRKTHTQTAQCRSTHISVLFDLIRLCHTTQLNWEKKQFIIWIEIRWKSTHVTLAADAFFAITIVQHFFFQFVLIWTSIRKEKERRDGEKIISKQDGVRSLLAIAHHIERWFILNLSTRSIGYRREKTNINCAYNSSIYKFHLQLKSQAV